MKAAKEHKPQQSRVIQNLSKVLQRYNVNDKPPKVDLYADEQDGGHTIANHVRKSDIFLIDRAQTIPERLASSYTDIDVANRATQSCLYHNWSSIAVDWRGIGRAGARGNISYTSPIPGNHYFYKLFNHKGKCISVDIIKVWLSRKTNAGGHPIPNEVYINTSYPTRS